MADNLTKSKEQGILTSNVTTLKQLGLLVRQLLVSGIRAYQCLSRALFFRNCRFYPSCSQYAIEAIERFGIARGVKKAATRILRCSPATDGGHDPVR